MDLFLECLPCVLKQAIDTANMNTQNPLHREQIMDESIEILADYRSYRNSPDIVREIHRVVREITGIKDPYAKIKKRDIKAAIQALPQLQKLIAEKNNKMYWTLKASATGNIIDAAIYDTSDFKSLLQEEFDREFAICDQAKLENDLKTAKTILIIGDNAGETVFDRLLVEFLDSYEIIYAVRSKPILNDATREDAEDSGLGDICTLMESGSTAPGTILDHCSDEFNEIFAGADIVISKGQGNYESLSDCSRPIYFALKAKCPVVASTLNVKVNDYVFISTNN